MVCWGNVPPFLGKPPSPYREAKPDTHPPLDPDHWPICSGLPGIDAAAASFGQLDPFSMGTLGGLGGVMTPGGITPQVAHVPGKDGGLGEPWVVDVVDVEVEELCWLMVDGDGPMGGGEVKVVKLLKDAWK